ncbi:DUF6479 family protein [Streptomyces sp. NPDC047082]|uniref:DUF6479 family protein n=1 Tax=Streptomyces sp. NPDC047082 TaxID=3155259 RepID=UPI0033CFBBB3
MNTALHDIVASDTVASASTAGAVVMLILGVLVTGALVWAVRLGIKVRRREPAPPGRGAHPTLPDSGPLREERQMREPDEVPRARKHGVRLTPHELRHSPSKRSENQDRPRWEPGASDSGGS